MRSLAHRWLLLAALGSFSLLACAPAVDPGPVEPEGEGKADWPTSSASKVREAKTAALLERLRAEPAALSQFIGLMPKGADLHTHLVGAVATERLIDWGIEEGRCLDATRTIEKSCTAESLHLEEVEPGSASYAEVLGAWSMAGQEERPLLARHQHFFDSFLKFGPLTWNRNPDMVAEVMKVAAAQQVSYLELMAGLNSWAGGKTAEAKMESGGEWTAAALAAARQEIVADSTFKKKLQEAKKSLDNWEDWVRQSLGCGSASPDPACQVEVRYIVQAIRTSSREYVFGQFVFGFELMQIDPRVVGVNLVQAEEDAQALAGVDDQMKAIGALRQLYQGLSQPVHVALHAGELVPELLPPENQDVLGTHVRKAVLDGTAERVGHGIDLAQDPDPEDLLDEMRDRKVLIELCLTSNAQLVGVEGDAHPIGEYLKAGVPAALATDDEGILRTSMSQEFLRAAQTHRLSYAALKGLARRSLEHSFLPGATLNGASVCKSSLTSLQLKPACADLLAQSARATLQWRLEEQLAAFEAKILAEYPSE